MKQWMVLGVVVLLGGIVSTKSLAEQDIRVRGAGGRLSFVSPDGVDATIGFGGIVDLGTITPEFGLEATLDFWSKSKGSGGDEVKFRDIIVGARGKYAIPVADEKLSPFAAAGLAVHLQKSETPEVSTALGTFGGDDTEAKIGVDLAAGVGYEIGENVDVVGEVMYRIVSDVEQFVLSAGLVFWFRE